MRKRRMFLVAGISLAVAGGALVVPLAQAGTNSPADTGPAPSTTLEKKIIDGEPSAKLEGQVQITRDGAYKCTGSLIDTSWVLTAKHCVREPFTPNQIEVRAGSRILNAFGEVRKAAALVRHPVADVALIRLESAVSQPNSVIQYDDTMRPDNNENVSIRGWGNTQPTGPGVISPVLRVATVMVFQNNGDVPDPPEVAPPQGTLVMHKVNGKPSSGDSGAGVVYQGKVVGVHAASDEPWRNTDTTYSVALEAIRGWIGQNMTASPPATQPPDGGGPTTQPPDGGGPTTQPPDGGGPTTQPPGEGGPTTQPPGEGGE